MSADQLDPDEGYRRRFDEQELLRAAEEAQEQLERNTRTIGDFLTEAMSDGTSVVIELGRVTISGYVVGVNSSLVRVRSSGRTIDVNAVAVTSTRVTGDRSGWTGSEDYTPPRFNARLRELTAERFQDRVRLVSTSQQDLLGHVEAASGDHIEFRTDDGDLWALPFDVVAYVEVLPPSSLCLSEAGDAVPS